jgi:UPF0755 protein
VTLTNKLFHTKSGLYVTIAVGILLIAGASVLIWYGSLTLRLKPVGTISRPTRVFIQRGETVRSLAANLEKQRLIRDKGAFVWYMRHQGWDRLISPGAYEFSPDQSAKRIAEIIAKHQVTRNWVTIPEGFRYTQIARRLARRGICSEDEFLALAANPKALAGEIEMPLPPGTVEGYLFPDTYRMPPGTGARAAMKMMLRRFEDVVYIKMVPELNRGHRSLHEVVTVASMIEREARVEKDRPLIASVIYNRLRVDMKLDIDATIQYTLGYWKPQLLYADLRIPSPYNTYMYRGLPPGPISNPGLDCLTAALKPAKTSYLYYVATPDGRHKFSSSLQEHNRAIHEVRLMRHAGGPT